MIIGVCGFGYTGSGAVLDFMKEFDENYVCEKMEFDITYLPDGLQDLEYNLTKNISRYYSSDTAIKRYLNFLKRVDSPKSAYNIATNGKFQELSRKFIDDLIQVRWKGFGGYDSILVTNFQRNLYYRLFLRVILLLESIFKKNINIPPVSNMFLSINPNNFNSLARDYISKIISSMVTEQKKNIVLDQPFSADNPQNSFSYFHNPIAITVDKDPRDMYLLAKTILLSKARFIPTENVWKFIHYYKAIHNQPNIVKDNPRILRVHFEDLIYRYEETKRKICSFTQVSNHTFPKKYFNPEVSINNTQLFKKYAGFQKDIETIERELTPWLYPFENYKNLKLVEQKPF